MTSLGDLEYRLLQALLLAPAPATIRALSVTLELDQSRVMAAATQLVELGLAVIDERSFEEYRLDEEGQAFVSAPLPERVIATALHRAGGRATVKDLPGLTGLEQKAIGQCLRFLQAKGWADKAGAELVLTPAGQAALEQPGPDEQLLAALGQAEALDEAEVTARGIDLPAARALLAPRKGLVRLKTRIDRSVACTDRARAEASTLAATAPRATVNQLTPAMLADGSWRDVTFRPYDLSAATEPAFPGKSHPFRRVLDETRRVFLEMGFEEIVSPYVECSFWDFDALFQPQDHPARDMQDTFYVARPGICTLPDPARVTAVRRTHEDGGDTGSLGWGYRWNEAMARRPVLRTHTTACTVRALARDPNPPSKVFCVGKVFRRETIDYKHLPVFYQVDGIIIDERASFASLLGTLSAFYRKMGFEKFQFRPAFFPYTEPSVEIFVYLEEKQDWVEMGGAGVFRPEVTEPLGCTAPVLAWGLGLERLAMFRYGLKDIRDLYVADLQWLKEAELCR